MCHYVQKDTLQMKYHYLVYLVIMYAGHVLVHRRINAPLAELESTCTKTNAPISVHQVSFHLVFTLICTDFTTAFNIISIGDTNPSSSVAMGS